MEMSVDMMSIATDFYANIDLINWQRSYFSTWASLWKKKIEEVASAGGTKSTSKHKPTYNWFYFI